MADPRRQSGNLQHNLMELLFTAVCSIVGGANCWTDVEEFVEAKFEWFRKFIPLASGVPSHDTYSRIFAALEPKTLMECLKRWVESLSLDLQGLGIHVDGKTLRGSFQGTDGLAAIHMVSAWVSDLGLCLGQVQTDQKSNEITAVPMLLELLEMKGAVVTMDAMNCQKKTLEKIREKGADFVVTVKGNQETLYETIYETFEGLGAENYPPEKCDSNQTVTITRGREEERLVVVTEVPESISQRKGWEEVQSIGMVYRHRHADPKSKATKPVPETDCVTFFISSLPAKADLLAKYVRGHWSVENQLHWSLDVNFTEDASRIRIGNGAAVFAHLRRFALSIIKQDTSIKKKSQRAKRLKAGWSTETLESIIFR